jgi:hypothetical protein
VVTPTTGTESYWLKKEHAEKYGAVAAKTAWQAEVKRTVLVLVPLRHDKYFEYSKLVNTLYERFIDMIEPIRH